MDIEQEDKELTLPIKAITNKGIEQEFLSKDIKVVIKEIFNIAQSLKEQNEINKKSHCIKLLVELKDCPGSQFVAFEHRTANNPEGLSNMSIFKKNNDLSKLEGKEALIKANSLVLSEHVFIETGGLIILGQEESQQDDFMDGLDDFLLDGDDEDELDELCNV